MAAYKKRGQAIGSAQWVKDERQELQDIVASEVEDFTHSARNELEWLNEHMAEIFAQRHMNVTDVFKTPGKLRGKTPRTIRKQDSQPRAPLTDIFAPNPQSAMSPARTTPFFQKISKISVAQDDPQITISASPPKAARLGADSGYHGTTEDEMEIEESLRAAREPTTEPSTAPTTEPRITEDSFVSAQEGDVAAAQSETLRNQENAEGMDGDGDHTVRDASPNITILDDAQSDSISDDATPTVGRTEAASNLSSPEKPLMRKSSLNFATLPPRQTLTGKRSLGPTLADARARDGVSEVQMAEYSAAAEHNKASVQRLQERINMLGQTKDSRNSKSLASPGSMYPALPRTSTVAPREPQDDDDSWIAPIQERDSMTTGKDVAEKSSTDSERAPSSTIYGQQKSISTSDLASPTKVAMAPEERQQKALSVCAPSTIKALTTPTASPRKGMDGPLSASKARFYSVLKSAKGMFASSAGTSAQAKGDTESRSKSPSRNADAKLNQSPSRMPGAFDEEPAAVVNNKSTISRSAVSVPSPAKEGRRTRSSTENERSKNKQNAESLDKARGQERKKAAEQMQDRVRLERADTSDKDQLPVESAEEEITDQPVEVKSHPQSGKLRAPARMTKPARPQAIQSSRPVPVNIRVASQVQRLGSIQPSTSSNSLVEVERPPSAVSRPGIVRAGSAAPASNARVKALEAAARKKEQDEKAAARKAEQKREMEKKRAAKLEEERRIEQEKRAEEQRRAQEARLAAQKQAEMRRLEQQRLEQQRREAAAKVQAEADLAEALEKEKAKLHAQQTARDATGTLRQITKATSTLDKPIKRAHQAEEESGSMAVSARSGPTYQQHDAKRRKTDDAEENEPRERHSVMAPPKRPSNMRKENISRFPHGYAHAPPPAAHHAQNIYKASVATQPIHHSMKSGPSHPSDTVKLSTAKIPFAENINPPGPHADSQSKTPIASAFKTPARPAHHLSSKTKSSPAYPNGDNIALPEINTDSEDESDSDDETSPATKNATASFRAPSWVASPALRDLLTQQQMVDPESVFGPIAALNMDEVFRGATGKNQERMKRYRDRGESAMWIETGDAVTSAEKKRDREARERVAREGGWSFTRD